MFLGVQSPACKEGNKVCSKIGALVVMQDILGLDVDAEAIPFQGDGAWNTIVEAPSVRNAEGIEVELDT